MIQKIKEYFLKISIFMEIQNFDKSMGEQHLEENKSLTGFMIIMLIILMKWCNIPISLREIIEKK